MVVQLQLKIKELTQTGTVSHPTTTTSIGNNDELRITNGAASGRKFGQSRKNFGNTPKASENPQTRTSAATKKRDEADGTWNRLDKVTFAE
jgi:hypothetical protein